MTNSWSDEKQQDLLGIRNLNKLFLRIFKKRSRGYHLQAKRTVLKVIKPQATYSASSGGFSSTRKTQFIRMVRITNDSKYLESELRKMNLLQTPI